MTAAVRTFNDLNVPPGVHTWRVRARRRCGHLGGLGAADGEGS